MASSTDDHYQRLQEGAPVDPYSAQSNGQSGLPYFDINADVHAETAGQGGSGKQSKNGRANYNSLGTGNDGNDGDDSDYDEDLEEGALDQHGDGANAENEEERRKYSRMVKIAYICLIIATCFYAFMGPSFVYLNKKGVTPLLGASWRHQSVTFYVLFPMFYEIWKASKGKRRRWLTTFSDLKRNREKRERRMLQRKLEEEEAKAANEFSSPPLSTANSTNSINNSSSNGTESQAQSDSMSTSLLTADNLARLGSPKDSGGQDVEAPGGFERSDSNNSLVSVYSMTADMYGPDRDDASETSSVGGDSMFDPRGEKLTELGEINGSRPSNGGSSDSQCCRSNDPRSAAFCCCNRYGCVKRSLRRLTSYLIHVFDRPLGMSVLAGLGWASALSGWVVSLKFTTTVNAALLSTLAPVALVIWLKLRGLPVSKGEVAGVFVAVIGVVLCISSAFINPERDNHGNEMAVTGLKYEMLGNGINLIVSCFMAATAIVSARARTEMPLFTHTCVVTVVVAVFQVICTLAIEGSHFTGMNNHSVFGWVTSEMIIQFLILGFIGGLIGSVGFAVAVKYVSPLVYTVVQLFDPVLTGVIAYFMDLEDAPTWPVYVGGVVVTAGILILVRSEDKRLKEEANAAQAAREKDQGHKARIIMPQNVAAKLLNLPDPLRPRKIKKLTRRNRSKSVDSHLISPQPLRRPTTGGLSGAAVPPRSSLSRPFQATPPPGSDAAPSASETVSSLYAPPALSSTDANQKQSTTSGETGPKPTKTIVFVDDLLRNADAAPTSTTRKVRASTFAAGTNKPRGDAGDGDDVDLASTKPAEQDESKVDPGQQIDNQV